MFVLIAACTECCLRLRREHVFACSMRRGVRVPATVWTRARVAHKLFGRKSSTKGCEGARGTWNNKFYTVVPCSSVSGTHTHTHTFVFRNHGKPWPAAGCLCASSNWLSRSWPNSTAVGWDASRERVKDGTSNFICQPMPPLAGVPAARSITYAICHRQQRLPNGVSAVSPHRQRRTPFHPVV